MMSPLRIVFAGTPEFGLPCLNAIWNSSHQIVGVYTQPDRPTGRGQHTQFSPIKQWALDQLCPVYQPLNFKEESTVEALAALKPDVIVVIAYGLLLPKSVLNVAPLGCINVHASLLPRWRGASPIQQVILHGDKTSGVTIMKMDVGLDTGPWFVQARLPVAVDETSGSLHDKLADLAVEPLMATLAQLSNHRNSPQLIHCTEQESQFANYAPKIMKEDAQINWTHSAEQIERQIRAYDPWPIARTFAKGEWIRIHQAHIEQGETSQPPGTILTIDKHGMLVATGNGLLRIERLQFAGGKTMSVADWVNGGRADAFMHVVLI